MRFGWGWRVRPQPPSRPGRWGQGSWSRTFLPRPPGRRWEALPGQRASEIWPHGLVAPQEAEGRRKAPPCQLRDSLLLRRASGRGEERPATKAPGFSFSVTTLQYLACRGYKGKRMWAQPGKNSPTKSSKVLGQGRQMALEAGLHPEGRLEPLAGQSAPLPLPGHHLGHSEFPKTLFPKAL